MAGFHGWRLWLLEFRVLRCFGRVDFLPGRGLPDLQSTAAVQPPDVIPIR
jgi:hypothetical protein